MIKKYKNTFILIIFFLISFIIMFFSKVDSDVMWNFGYTYNTVKGLLMYKDFNMVISPLYPTITGLLMKILGNNMLSFYIINATYATLVAYLASKIATKSWLLSLPLILFSCLANYNTICILLCLLIIYLEKKNSNDYFIGIILGLCFLTKINIGILLCIPSLFYFKDFKKIAKRITGFIIPNILVIIIFWFMNNLYNYIDYVFLGILDFAGNNLQLSFLAIIIPIIFIFLIISFFKKKDISYLYSITFLGLIYPVMNELHVIMAIVPGIILLMKKYDYKLEKLAFLGLIFMLFSLISLYFVNQKYEFSYDKNIFKNRHIQSEYIKNANDLKRYFDNDFKNVYFMTYDNYIYKFLLDLPINKYDVLLYGNMGYNGTKKLINYLKSAKEDTYFIFDSIITGAQYNIEGLKYVQKNYDLKAIVGNFYIYQK